MKNTISVLSILLGFFAGLSGAVADTLFKNVNIVSIKDKKIHKNSHVLTEGDRIKWVITGDITGDLDGVDVVDGTGKYLIGGLAEMHGHLPPANAPRQLTEDTLFLYVSRGVTTVRGMLGDKIQMDYRDEINAGEIIGPNLYLAAPSLNGSSVNSVEEGVEKVRRYAKEGWDLQKIHPGLTMEQYNAIIEEADKHNFPLGGHVPAEVGIVRALEAGQMSIDHLDGYMELFEAGDHDLTEAELKRAVEMTLKSGTWIVPTQELFDLFFRDPNVPALMARDELKYMSKNTLASWERRVNALNQSANAYIARNRQALLKAMADAGVGIALGSDAPQLFSVPGFSIIREIEIMKDAGLTPWQILEAGVKNPGVYFKDKDTFGLIDKGHRADFVLLEDNPLEDIMNVGKQAGVMVAGRWYSKGQINVKLAEIARRNSN